MTAALATACGFAPGGAATAFLTASPARRTRVCADSKSRSSASASFRPSAPPAADASWPPIAGAPWANLPAALRVAAPDTGAYVNECDYFQPDWQRAFWGPHYPRLAGVKRRYDPDGLFTVHHGVGSEA